MGDKPACDAWVRLAARTFQVGFSQRTTIDVEHGTLGAIGTRHLAEFFLDPGTVAGIAELKLHGELRDTDGEYPIRGVPRPHSDRVRRALERWSAACSSDPRPSHEP